MSLLKEVRNLAIISSAFVAFSFGITPANAAPIVFASAGTCVGADTSGGGGSDCVTAVGHINASVVSTLTINEIRAINFGNMSKTAAAPASGGSKLVLDPATGGRSFSANPDAIVLLHGANASGGPASTSSGGQFAGVYRVTGDTEGTAQQVYISFADTAGNIVDYSGDDFYTANDNNIHVTGPGTGGTAYFTVNDFTISCLNQGSDVYGHYCDNSATPTDVKVGATLNTIAGQTYTEGKYTGTFNVMVSY